MKQTTIDDIPIHVEHCNGGTKCPHYSDTGWCFHPIFDKGQAKDGEDIKASFMLDKSIPKGCPLTDLCPECEEPMVGKRCDSNCCQKVRD